MIQTAVPATKQRPGSFGAMMQQIKPALTGRPITPRENMRRVLTGEKPAWMPAWVVEIDYIWPDVVLEHPAYEYDGKDWWGTEWVWVEVAGGMMVKPGTRVLSDITKWKQEVVFPDLDAVDWENDAKRQKAFYRPDHMHLFHLTEGVFERLHELMPFEEALEAMILEKECVLEFFEAMADYKIELLKRVFHYYDPIDYIIYGDDWGTQRAGFFSNEMYREMILPSAKRIMDYVKSEGKFIELHSCGLNQQYVPMFIEMGIDAWAPQPINDSRFLKQNYGDKMSFALAVPGLDAPGLTEDQARQIVRNFVDEFAPGGRTYAQVMAPDPAITNAVLDELYSYSRAYYENND